ncbi:MAG TPA: Spy/CpxP family protein refolding chaperone [Burkholderiaceae bacterium]
MRTIAASLLLSTLFAGAAIAQPVSDFIEPSARHGALRMAPENLHAWNEERAAKKLGHEQALRAKLQLSVEQEGAWQAYMAAARAPHPQLALETNSLPLPQRLEVRAENLKAQQARMEAHAKAVKQLYGALTPQQRQVFEASLQRG